MEARGNNHHVASRARRAEAALSIEENVLGLAVVTQARSNGLAQEIAVLRREGKASVVVALSNPSS